MPNPQETLIHLEQRLGAMEVVKEEKRQRLQAMIKEMKDLETEHDLLEKVEATLQHIGSKVLGQSTQTIDKLLTTGLRLVFEDQDLTFRTKVEKFRGKTAIKFELFDGAHTAPLMDAYGGGVLAVAGVLLRVVTIVTLNMKRVLFLDETLAHLSDQYHANASRLLKKLCDELGFTILMVSHQPAFAEHATTHYLAVQKAGATVFKKDPTR